MGALRIARLCLLCGIVLWGAALALGYFELIDPGLGMLLGLIAAVSIISSSVACVAIQVAHLFRRRKS